MPKTAKTEKSTPKTVKAAAAVDVEQVALAAVAEVQKSVTKSKKAGKAKAVAEPAPAPAPVVEAPVEEVVEEESSAPRKQRRQVTREDVEKSFDALVQSIEDEVEALRKNDDKNKTKGVRFLRSVVKQVRQLKTDSLRVASKRVRRQGAPRATNSGFMKPVKISKDMQKFTGIKDDQLVSRVDVTKAICQYVKSHNLQNEADRRQFTPDEKLAKLLGTTEPLTYYALQKQIQPHFIKA
jgi:chromatin remodeling complex protein RSC6